MKRSYMVTIDEPDCGEVEPHLLEEERAALAALVIKEGNGCIHVTVSHVSGLPGHPFKPGCPNPALN